MADSREQATNLRFLVCGIESITNTVENVTTINKVMNIAGDYSMKTGMPLDSEVMRLKNSDSHVDAEKEGVRVVLSGGTVPLEKGGVKQKAVIEFICDPSRDGTETEKPAPGDLDGDDDDKESSLLQRRADDKKDDDKPEGPLVFKGYKTDSLKGEDWGILRLEWSTKYACEDFVDRPVNDVARWGFFTWLIIMYVSVSNGSEIQQMLTFALNSVFLGVAAYLIFGSWLNYNRYGARGWDLIPHGDAIRDIPYVMKDFGRRVATTVQGPGTRGGYSAV
jgi:hypothetical protein